MAISARLIPTPEILSKTLPITARPALATLAAHPRTNVAIDPDGDKSWISFQNFPSLKAARAVLGKLPDATESVTNEGLHDLLTEGFLPEHPGGISGHMRTASGWRDRA